MVFQFDSAGRRGLVVALMLAGCVAGIFALGGRRAPAGDPLTSSIPGWEWWSALGSTASIDDADRNVYDTAGPTLKIRSNAPERATLNFRYGVTWTDGADWSNSNEEFQFWVRYRDNGSGARVILRLKSLEDEGGMVQTHFAFDSDDYPQSDAFQTQRITVENPDWDFRFDGNVYFIDGVLIKRDADGAPALGSITVWADDGI